MNDTSSFIEKRFREMMMEKSGEERLKMGFSMFNDARKMVIASICKTTQNCNSEEIRKLIFLRFYGDEFSKEIREKILKRIRCINTYI